MSSRQASWSTISYKEYHDNNKIIENVTYELVGLITYISIGGNKYGLVIIDDYYRFT
jgi:hypothetical protein